MSDAVVFRSSPLVILCRGLCGVAFLLAFAYLVWMWINPEGAPRYQREDPISWQLVVVLAFPALLFAWLTVKSFIDVIAIRSGKRFLMVLDDGFEEHHWQVSRKVAFADCSRFVVGRTGFSRWIAFYNKRARPTLLRRLGKTSSTNDFLSGTYGVPAKRLADLLNEKRLASCGEAEDRAGTVK